MNRPNRVSQSSLKMSDGGLNDAYLIDANYYVGYRDGYHNYGDSHEQKNRPEVYLMGYADGKGDRELDGET